MPFRQRKSPPANEADFERLCLRLLKAYWHCPTLELYGRRGEHQSGIDILDMSGLDPLKAAQCKLYDPRKSLPYAVIRAEVDAAKEFSPAIGVYALMTTAKVSAETQRTIIEINRVHVQRGLFVVELFTWDRIDELLDEFPAIRDEIYRTLAGEAVHQIQEGLAQINVQMSSLQLTVSSGTQDNSDVLHLEIDEARNLVQEGESQNARFLLQRMRRHKWDQMGPRHRFRVLSNLAAAYLHEREFARAAQLFTEAASFQPDDVQASENLALGCLISLPLEQAFSEISHLLAKFPNSARIASFWITAAPSDWTMEEIRARLTVAQQSAPEPTASLAMRALAHSQFSLCEALVTQSLVQRPEWSYPQLIKARCLVLKFLNESIDLSPGFRTEQLRKAENLLTSALQAAIKERDLPIQVECLLERSQIHLLLSQQATADQDVRNALILVPKDHAVRRSVADMQLRHGQVDDALRELRTLLSDGCQPDIALRLGFALAGRKQNNDIDEAIRLFQSVVNYSGPVPTGGREYVASVLLQLLLQRERWADAEVVCDTLTANRSSEALVSGYRARIMLLQDRLPDANALADSAISSLADSAPPEETRWIAHLLSDLGRYAEALPLWYRIAPRDTLSEDTKHLLNCAMRLDRDDLIIEISAALRNNGIIDRELTLYEVQTLERYDIEGTVQVLDRYLQRYPEDKHVRLRRSLIGLTWNRPDIVDADPSLMPSVQEVDAQTGRIAVQVMKLGRFPNEALAYGYKLLRSKFGEPDAHRAFMFNLHPIDPLPVMQEFGEVRSGAAVSFIEDGEAETNWAVIEDEPEPDADRSEYAPQHPVAQALIGKKVGDRVVLSEGSVSERTATITAILSKYVFRYQECLRNWQLRFPGAREIESVKVRRILPDGKEQFDLSAILRSMDHLTANIERLKEAYRTEIVPIPMIAALRGKTTVETTLYLAQAPDTQVVCCLGTADERSQAFKALDVSSTWILEPSAVATILLLGIEDTLSGLPITFLMSQGTTAELNEILREESLFRGNGGVLTRIEHRTTFIPITPLEKEQRRELLQLGIEKLKSASTIVSCVELARLDAQQRDTAIKVFGQGGAESVVLASQPGRLLWSDDYRLAAAAKNDFGVKSAWTQSIIQWAASKGFLEPEMFANLSAKLIGFGYYFSSPSPASLMAAAKLADWNPTHPPLTAALAQLGTQSIDPKAAAVLAVFFLQQTYREVIFDERRRLIVQLLLDKLAERVGGMQIIQAIKESVPAVFGLNVLGAADLLSTIVAWSKVRALRR